MGTIKSTIQVGQKFHRWLVIGEPTRRKNQRIAKCLCDCGTVRDVRLSVLGTDKSQSCGCLRIELRTTHGQTRNNQRLKSSEYSSWNMMRQRTSNPRNKRYADYGGRGISVCERWHSFENFYSDMGPRPSKDHSIERIDNSGNYEPSNCRWATRIEQATNTRKNRVLTVNGASMCISDWARKTGLSRKMISSRLSRGWSEELAVTTPPTETNVSMKSARDKRLANIAKRKSLGQTV